MTFSSCLRERILLSQPMKTGVLTSAIVLFSSSVATPAIALESRPDDSNRNSTTVQQSPEESSETLTSQELIQTIRGLELVEVFDFSSVESQEVKAVQSALREIARQSSSPYEIPASQLKGLQNIFSSLSEEEVATVNQMLLIQQAEASFSLSPEEVAMLQKALEEIPQSNLSQSQKGQLTVISSALNEVSEQEGLSSEQLENLQSAIAQVFFTPETRPSQTARQTEEREETLVAHTNPPRFNQQNAQSSNPSQEIAQSPRQEFRSNLATHLTDSTPEAQDFLLSTLTDNNIPQEEAENLITNIENLFQEVEGGEIVFRIEIARRITRAQQTFNEVVEALDTEILEAPPDSLLTIRGVIAEAVAATGLIEDVEDVEDIDPPEPLPDDEPQTREDLISQLMIPDPETEEVLVQARGGVPAIGINVPSGFGSQWGRVSAGVAYQASTRPNEAGGETGSDSGSFGFGMGFGDPEEAVGLEVSYTSFGIIQGENYPFSRGGFSFKLHRRVTDTSSIAIGAENLITYGNTNVSESFYGSFTNIFRLSEDTSEPFSQIAVTAGLGGGRFREFQDILDDRDRVNVFGSLGFRLANPVSLVTAYNGQSLTVGASIAPFEDTSLVITPSLTDLTGNVTDSPRFVITVGYGDRLFE